MQSQLRKEARDKAFSSAAASDGADGGTEVLYKTDLIPIKKLGRTACAMSTYDITRYNNYRT